jgi:subtilisin family serine protease
MNILSTFFIAMVILLLSLTQGCAANNDGIKPDLIVFSQPMVLVIEDPRTVRRRFGAPGPGYSATINYAEDPILSRVSKQLVDEYQLVAADQWPLESLGVYCILVEGPATDTIDRLLKDPRVKWIQPFNEFDTQTSDAERQKLSKSSVLLANTSLPNQGAGIDIIVIDTGLDRSHPAFDGSNISYENFVFNKSDSGMEIHGTAVTGLLSAGNLSQNNLVKGLVYRAKMHHYRGCWQDPLGVGKCSTLTLALALDKAVQTNPNVLNLSLSGPEDKILEALISKLLEQGTVIVSAHDNNRTENDRFPLAREGVLYAFGMGQEPSAALSQNTFLASNSMISLSPMGNYDIFSGHSIAAPQISAITVSLLSKNPKINNHTIANRLKEWLTAQTILEASEEQN